MKWLFIVFSLITVIQAATTTLTTSTLVWATGTNADGVLTTTQSAYVQTFTSFHDGVASPSSGAIGLGSLTGSVGGIRTYERLTVSAASSADSIKYNSFTKLTPLVWIISMSSVLAVTLVIFA